MDTDKGRIEPDGITEKIIDCAGECILLRREEQERGECGAHQRYGQVAEPLQEVAKARTTDATPDVHSQPGFLSERLKHSKHEC